MIDLLEMFALVCLLILKLLFTGYENFWIDGWMDGTVELHETE